jgi:hypothetical protein
MLQAELRIKDQQQLDDNIIIHDDGRLGRKEHGLIFHRIVAFCNVTSSISPPSHWFFLSDYG